MFAGSEPSQQKKMRHIWRTPGSPWNWFFLLSSLLILGWVFLLYRLALAAQPYPGPYTDPLRLFGVIAFVLVVLVAAYTLRRRFVRSLPGKMQNWLWLHIWFGIISMLIACMHDNFQGMTHDISFLRTRFTEAAYGTTALYALLVLVITGIVGRLLDLWQARTIAVEADTNGVGIARSVEERLRELALALERIWAGKSPHFKQSYAQAVRGNGSLSALPPGLAPGEASDLQHACVLLGERTRLTRSLKRQQSAQRIIQVWRAIHIPLACVAVAIITYHSLFELWKWLVLHQ